MTLEERIDLMRHGRLLKILDNGSIVFCVDDAIRFIGDMDIDSDGGPNVDHDPCWQPDTTLHFNGHAINSQIVPYVVAPIGLFEKVKGIGLGCKCVVTHLKNKLSCDAVCADLGPATKDGEGSAALARRLGVNPNSRTGGEDRPVVFYELYVGIPAIIDGVTYDLQPLHSR